MNRNTAVSSTSAHTAGALSLAVLVLFVGCGAAPDAGTHPLAAESADSSKNGVCRAMRGRGPQMLVIQPPRGEERRFLMGSPVTEANRREDEAQHGVSIASPYAMGRCEVTVGEFRRFAEATGYRTDAERALDSGAGGHRSTVRIGSGQFAGFLPASQGGCVGPIDGSTDSAQDPTVNWRNPGFEQTEQHPVVCVTWRDATAYVAWLSLQAGVTYRLPTEAEWEYATRAGTVDARYWQDGPNAICAYANVADRPADVREAAGACDDPAVFTSEVASHKANAYGLFDALGNVEEWTADCWNPDYSFAPVDGSSLLDSAAADCNYRVARGSSWKNRWIDTRSARRGAAAKDTAFSVLGFRVARSL